MYTRCSMVRVYLTANLGDVYGKCWSIFQHHGAYGNGISCVLELGFNATWMILLRLEWDVVGPAGICGWNVAQGCTSFFPPRPLWREHQLWLGQVIFFISMCKEVIKASPRFRRLSWIKDPIWLVVWNIYIFPSIGNSHPNWLRLWASLPLMSQLILCQISGLKPTNEQVDWMPMQY